ncbi:UNVERIFIED_CONTAM: hypothetical protein PYX00_002474 [Menopon gallinae]|uniref:Uncharacterized protein n=1 Tax=Menopon gallinae TaxID=328185 RepID=A0AAW2IGM4_9NEOP
MRRFRHPAPGEIPGDGHSRVGSALDRASHRSQDTDRERRRKDQGEGDFLQHDYPRRRKPHSDQRQDKHSRLQDRHRGEDSESHRDRKVRSVRERPSAEYSKQGRLLGVFRRDQRDGETSGQRILRQRKSEVHENRQGRDRLQGR